MNADIQPIGPWTCELGESPVWREDTLYWVDIAGCRLYAWQPDTLQCRHWDFPWHVGCCAPVAGGGWLLAARPGLYWFDEHTGKTKPYLAAPYDPTQERFNDGVVDTQGRLWVGTCSETGEGGLYCLNGQDLSLKRTGVSIANGLAFDAVNNQLYFADSPTGRISRFKVEANTLTQETDFKRFDPAKGQPDGAALDSEGAYWIAMYGAGRVYRLDPTGQILQEMVLPVSCPTKVCFGGPDWRTLYITSAKENRPADELSREPLAGCVLAVKVDVPGLPANVYLP